MKQYDYIIAGAGAAGLSLLKRMMAHPYFNQKQILVIDNAIKKSNDRTWCFWEKQDGVFQNIVFRQWNELHFYSAWYSSLLYFEPYSYKMIRSADLYTSVLQEAAHKSNITFLQAQVEAMGNDGPVAKVIANGETFTASFIFNSIVFTKPVVPADKYFLLQHFKGWMIETPAPCFNPLQAILMDFRVDQSHGTTFVYVLPVSETKALVEYTLFTRELLPDGMYDEALAAYIKKWLQLEHYTVTETEYGVIPMTNMKFVKRMGNIINVGTAGGQTKASSGYTFNFIQKQSDNIIKHLVQTNTVQVEDKLWQRRFNLYDSTLLNILHNQTMGGDKIFADLFQNNAPETILRFLDNESNLQEELNIMYSVSTKVFLKAAMHEIFK